MIKYDIMVTMSHTIEQKKIALEAAVRNDSRPYIISGRQDSSVYHYPAMLEIRRDARQEISGMTNGTGNLLFAFSNAEFDISYKDEAGSSTTAKVHAAVIPGQTKYRIHANGTLHLFSAVYGLTSGKIGRTIGYTKEYIQNHLEPGKANKLVVPRHIYGEELAYGGERMDSVQTKYVALGTANQEFSAGNSNSPQNTHVHLNLVETYTTFSGMTMWYMTRGRVERIEVDSGETVVVPKGVAHKARMHGIEPTFVTMAGNKDIFGDKFVMPIDFEEIANARRSKRVGL